MVFNCGVSMDVNVVDKRCGEVALFVQDLLDDTLENLRQRFESERGTTEHVLFTFPSKSCLDPVLQFDGKLVEGLGEVNLGDVLESLETFVHGLHVGDWTGIAGQKLVELSGIDADSRIFALILA